MRNCCVVLFVVFSECVSFLNGRAVFFCSLGFCVSCLSACVVFGEGGVFVGVLYS